MNELSEAAKAWRDDVRQARADGDRIDAVMLMVLAFVTIIAAAMFVVLLVLLVGSALLELSWPGRALAAAVGCVIAAGVRALWRTTDPKGQR